MASTEPSPSNPPRCPCGFDKHHGLVRKQPHYSVWGSLGLIFAGAGVRPKRIDYVCPRCNTTLDTVTDPVELKKFH